MDPSLSSAKKKSKNTKSLTPMSKKVQKLTASPAALTAKNKKTVTKTADKTTLRNPSLKKAEAVQLRPTTPELINQSLTVATDEEKDKKPKKLKSTSKLKKSMTAAADGEKEKKSKSILKKDKSTGKTPSPETNLDVVDEKLDSVKHANLLKAVSNLDGKKAAISIRGETMLTAPEDHKREKNGVNMGKVLKTHKKVLGEKMVKSFINETDESCKLPEPVERIYVKKAERAVKYTETKSEVEKWQTIVEDNRVIPQQQFPLERSRLAMPTATSEAKLHQPQNAMELEIQALLRGPTFVAEQAALAAVPTLNRAEERAQKAMDIAKAREEMALRRKHRRMVADLASKNRRQGKIKSRSYHRHLKGERRKNAFKALEKLKAEDPESWKEKAEEVEQARVEERATLRHKGKSKFAKVAKRYGKFNEKIKDSLDEMRAKGVELMTKQPEDEPSSEDESEEEQRDDVHMEVSDEEQQPAAHGGASPANPWMRSKLSKEAPLARQPYQKPEPLLNTAAFDEDSSSDSDGEAQDDADVMSPHKGSDSVILIEPDMSQTLQDDRQREAASKRSKEEAVRVAAEIERDADEMVAGQSTLRIQTRADVDRFDDGFCGTAEADGEESSDEETAVPASDAQDLDPNKVISIPSTDLSGAVRPHTGDSDSEDDQHRLNIAEAFADDDVVEEFSARRKRKYEDEDAAEDAAEALNTLPGWGKWAGAGIQEKKPRKRMTRWEKEKRRVEDLKKAEQQVDRDQKRSKYPKGVIVNEQALRTQPIAKYQVQSKKSRLTATGFTAMMSHPIGKEFVPTLAHNELCKPRVVTSIGAIIAPMSRDLVKEGKKQTFPRSNVDSGKKLATQYTLEPLRKKWDGRRQARKLVKS